MGAEIVVGYDVETDCVGKIKMDLRTHIHGFLTGQSGSGKSVALLWLLRGILSLDIPIQMYVCDPKNSKDFDSILPSDHYATGMEQSAEMIHRFYEIFKNTPENNGDNGELQFIIIDEYAGLIQSLPDIIGGKDGKAEVEKIKSEMASMMMLSRSRGIGVISVAQRFSTNLYAASSGAGDNYHWILNMGKLHTQTHISLFANEHLENEEFAASYHPSHGSGYFLQDGQPLKAIRIPLIRDKAAMTKLLQKKARDKFGNF